MEIGKRVVIDRHTAGKPDKGVIMNAQHSEFAGAGEAGQRSVQPQGDEQTWIDGRSSAKAAASTNAVIQRCKVQLLDIGPDSAGRVVWLKKFIDGHGRKQLQTIRDGQTRGRREVWLRAGRRRGVGPMGTNSSGSVLRRGASHFDGRQDHPSALFGVLVWSHRLAPSRSPWASAFIIRSGLFHRLSDVRKRYTRQARPRAEARPRRRPRKGSRIAAPTARSRGGPGASAAGRAR